MDLTIIFLLLISFGPHPNLGQGENRDKSRCPVNFRYDPATGSCMTFCKEGDDHLCNGSSVAYEVAKPKEGFPHELNFAVSEPNASWEEPIVDIRLPPCKIVTFGSQDVVGISADGVTVAVGKAGPVTIAKYEVSADNKTVTLCYPLSPQLLQCKLKQLAMANYVMLSNKTRTLLNHVTNETIGFRDYYTDPTTSRVIGCTEHINESRKLRCNYVIYRRDEYELGDGNVTIYLVPTNETIYRPSFTEVANTSGDINLCYPSTPSFTLCPKLWYLEKSEFMIKANHRLHSFSHHLDYDLGEFFIFPDRRAVVCVPDQPTTSFDFFVIHASLYVVSAICLLVAFVIHLILPSLNYHAKPLLCHMLSMLVMYTSLATRKFMTNITPGPCYTLFITTYVSALASFFWLSVLAFDLWSIFANLQTSSRLGCRPWACGSKDKRFYYYSAYAWGLPVFLCVVTVILDTHGDLQDALELYPGIAKMCWFNTRKAAYLLLYGPMFTMLAINVTLFILTVANLRRASKGAEVVNKKLNQQLLFVCIRLFIVMGLCWMVEAVTWTLDLDAAALYIPDIVIAVQGIIIFAIYICKPTTYRLLRRKFAPNNNLRSSDTRWTTDGQHSKSNVESKSSNSGISMKSTNYANDQSKNTPKEPTKSESISEK